MFPIHPEENSTSLFHALQLAELLSSRKKLTAPLRIAFTGAGGKTTSILNLAEECRQHGYTVLILTTTHMQSFAPDSVLSNKLPDILAKRDAEGICIAGSKAGDHGMCMTDESVYINCIPHFDLILYEADGSRMLPIKTPAEYEPVFLEDTLLQVVCLGLSAIGNNLENACHRYERLSPLPADTIITPKLAADILQQGYGHFPYQTYYLLNQADDSKRKKAGEEISSRLTHCILMSYAETNRNPR